MSNEETNTENYVADRPISLEKEDAFQRYGFAKRIAETIIQRQSKESIVFGIYGAWGEGKTSIINLIRSEISKHGENFVQITFNPWRFTDEAALLTSFFNKLASELKLSIPDDGQTKLKKLICWVKSITTSENEPLKTSKENIGDLIQKYGKIAAIFGAGEVAETIGKAISNVDLDELKDRIEKLLEYNKKRIVIYIDDIDRLDKTEIHSIFRLVKLTGDFSYTTYILSFDQDMVASALGERFGSGDKTAGVSFLEKIIQVPLNIPKVQPDSLKNFCFNLFNKALHVNDITLTEEEVRRFVYQFTTNIIPRLTSPRLAIRYGNTLSFIMPLLKGEVNMIDLMLIEALKVFYPEHYYLVKDNSTYFIDSYSNSSDNAYKIIEIKNLLKEKGHDLSKQANEDVINLISDLFPKLGYLLGNGIGYSTTDDWYRNKRIVSSNYFERYFSYTVLEGEISDVEFEYFLNKVVSNETSNSITDYIRRLLSHTTADNFIIKLRSREQEFKLSTSLHLIKSICNISDLLPSEGGLFSMVYGSPFGQAALFITQIIINNKGTDELDIFDFIKELMTFPKQFSFAYEIYGWLKPEEGNENKLFSDTQYRELAEILTNRAVLEAGEDSIFEKFPGYIHFLSRTLTDINKESFDNYVKSYLDRSSNNVVILIKSFVPTIRSSSRPNPYKGDLSNETYAYLVSFIDKNLLYEKIITTIPLEELEIEELYWEDYRRLDFSEKNMLRQFVHRYKLEENLSN